jgi:molybdopterin-containing oxidoreductase family iron-sulfur binding subunit
MEKGRRNFIEKGILGTCAVATGCTCSTTANNSETVELLGTSGEILEIETSDLHEHGNHTSETVEVRQGIENRKFVMVIDLGRCRNARSCVTACQKMHHRPSDVEWLQVKLMKDSEQGAPYWLPKTCFHCDNPPCVKVCPVDATFKRTDGIVLIDNEQCIGCKFCMAACPYSTRVFNWDEPEQPAEILNKPHDPETGLPARLGTVEKCDFCPDMARQGKLPDCVTACPNGAFYFGDQNEDAVSNGAETVQLSKLLKDKAGYRLHEELGTEPRVYYLPPRGRMFDPESGLKDLPEEEKEMYEQYLNEE